MGFYNTLKSLVLSCLNKPTSKTTRLEALILNCQKTGKKTSNGDEVKLLLHISPSNSRSYLQEYIDVYEASIITRFLQPGQLVNLEMNSTKGKTILIWKE